MAKYSWNFSMQIRLDAEFHPPSASKCLQSNNLLTFLSNTAFPISRSSLLMGYWHQRADKRHGNPLQGNQELLVVRDKVGRPPGELGVSNSMECDIFLSMLWHCWLGDRKGIRPVKKLDVGLLVVMIWLELCTIYS